MFVGEALQGLANLDDVVLVASELAANVITHARTEFTVAIEEMGSTVRLEVSDGSSIMPAVGDLADSYTGLRVVQQLSTAWGVEGRGDGKTVWVEFTTD
jgi:hypothetical protein